jgi:sigma-B regulation protein RsbU (phosphoserine phosphatase)
MMAERSLEIANMTRVAESTAPTESRKPGSTFGTTAHSLRPLREQLSMARAGLNRELKEVGEIQRSLLPAELPDIPGFDVASYYQPCEMAGGDYFDIVPLTKDRWGLVMADVAGHGVSATVIMAVMRALVHAHLPHTRYFPANAFLEFINEQMTGAYTANGRFVTVWAAVLDPLTRSLTYASAGHNPPRLLRRGTVTALDAVGGLPLGIEESATYEEVTIGLESGDLLVIYTDGITEAMREGGRHWEYFATGRLDQVLLKSGRDSALDCVRRVTRAVNAFTQTNVPTDDQTMLVVRVN